MNKMLPGAPGWLSRLGVWLQFRSWFHSLWVRAPRRACADSSEPGGCFWFCVSSSLCPAHALSLSLNNKINVLKKFFLNKESSGGCLGGSVGWASDFGSGHYLAVSEFEPRIRPVLTARSLEAASDSVSPSLSVPPPLMLCLSHSQKWINVKKKN